MEFQSSHMYCGIKIQVFKETGPIFKGGSPSLGSKRNALGKLNNCEWKEK